jgi:uncharacterized protein YigA (DUF484 family)
MTKPKKHEITGEDVLNFLADHPDFFIENGKADWLFNNDPNGVVNLGRAVTNRAQAALKRSAIMRKTLLDITTVNHEIQQHNHHLALLIVAAQSRDEIATLIRDTMPKVLDLAAATLVVGDHLDLGQHPKVISLDKGYLPKLTEGSEFALGSPVGLKAEVFRNLMDTPPKSVAFAFLPAILPEQDHDIVVAMAGHKNDSFTEGHGTDFLQFIAAMVAVALVARHQDEL